MTNIYLQDPTLADAKVVIDLIDSIKPGSINYELVRSGGTEEVCLRCPFVCYFVRVTFYVFAGNNNVFI